jgi:hypothetical protein
MGVPPANGMDRHAACQRNGQVTLNAEAAHCLPEVWTSRRLTAEWSGLIKCRGGTSLVRRRAFIRNKCRGRVTRRPYVRLRPLAYVTRSWPRGSIGSLPGRGAEAYADRSSPDWTWTRVGTGPPPGSCSRPVYVLSWDLGTPLWATRTPFQGFGLHTWRSGATLGGPDSISGGPVLSCEGPDHC